MASNELTVPRLPVLLGYAGLIPFIVLSAALWFLPTTYQVLINGQQMVTIESKGEDEIQLSETTSP